MLRRTILLSLGLLVTVISYAEPSPSPPPPNSCIWFADDALYQIQTASTNPSPLTIPLKLGETGLLAMNAKDCGVWALTKKYLLHYDATGAQTHRIELRRLNPALGKGRCIIFSTL